MKNRILIATVACLYLAPFWTVAQETYFPTNKGAVLTYNCSDNSPIQQGEKNYHVRYTVTGVENNSDNIDITYMIESIVPGKKPKVALKEEGAKVRQSGENFYCNMRDFVVMPNVKNMYFLSGDQTTTGTGKTQINSRTTASASATIKLKSTYKTLNITDGNVALPLQPTLVSQIPNANMRIDWTEKQPMQVNLNIIKPHMTVDVTNFQVEAVDEEITVQAGTFKCIRVSSDAKVTVTGLPAVRDTNTRYTHWYAKGVGLVKMESKGIITNTMELIEVK